MVNCALCHRALPVFEQFPLVDGTLFLSPSRHDEIEYDVPCHLQGQTAFTLFWIISALCNDEGCNKAKAGYKMISKVYDVSLH